MRNEIPLLLHPPKTGGTSIHNALVELHGIDALPMKKMHSEHQQHKPYYSMHHKYHKFGLPDNYPAAITVRNPYTRLWSLFQHRLHLYTDLEKNHTPDNKTLCNWFGKFLSRISRRAEYWTRIDVQPCAKWMCDQVQHVIHFENFANDVRNVYGFDIDSFDHVYNRGAVNNVADVVQFYTQAHLDTVNLISEKDFAMFGYERFAHIDELKSQAQIK